MIKTLRHEHRLVSSKGSRKFSALQKSQLWRGPKSFWPYLSAPVCSSDPLTSLITDQRKVVCCLKAKFGVMLWCGE